jgi:uncharacterized protein
VNDLAAKEHAVSTDVVMPWYRQGWPWFLIALPATAVIGGIITAILAVRGFDGPVVADYYKQGLAINEEVARAQLARELAIAATVELAGFKDGDRVRVVLEAERALPPEAALRLRLAHPGRPAEDRVAVLARIDVDVDNRRAVYVGSLQSATPGAELSGPVTWQVILESAQWRIDDSFSAGSGGRFNLKAR